MKVDYSLFLLGSRHIAYKSKQDGSQQNLYVANLSDESGQVFESVCDEKLFSKISALGMKSGVATLQFKPAEIGRAKVARVSLIDFVPAK